MSVLPESDTESDFVILARKMWSLRGQIASEIILFAIKAFVMSSNVSGNKRISPIHIKFKYKV